MGLLSEFEGQGVFVSWPRVDTSGDVTHYKIQRGPYIDGPWTDLAEVDFPTNDYVDVTADRMDYYYKVFEMDSGENVLFEHYPIYGQEVMLRSNVYYIMQPYTDIRIYDEEPIFIDDDRTVAQTGNWNPWNYNYPNTRVRISAAQSDGDREPFFTIPQHGTTNLDNTGSGSPDYASLEWYTDYNSKIYFVDSSGDPVSIARHDIVLVDYSFPAIDSTDINNALHLAIGEIVSQPGVNKMGYATGARGIGNPPRRWDAAITAGACWWLLHQLMMMLTHRERVLAFEREGIFNDMKSMADDFKESFKEQKENIRIERYPSPGTIVTPEFQLPGQRQRFFRMAFKGY